MVGCSANIIQAIYAYTQESPVIRWCHCMLITIWWQGCNYHWGSCLVWFSQKKTERERESERKRKWAKDKISISALLKGIFGMWCLSGFIFVFDVGCFSGFIFAVSWMLDLLLLISRHISEIKKNIYDN